jgi:hypothetical protein
LLVDTTRGVLDVARAKRAAAAADTKTARSSEKRARLRLDRCLASVAEHPTPELRVAAAVLTNALAALAHTSDGLTLGRDGEWFRMNAEEQVDLSKKPTLARLARVLAEAHIRGEREPIPRGQLIERVWPAERIDATAAANRLAVTLSKLRGLGLSGEIEASSRGIRLRPELVVRVEGQSS